MANVDFPSNPTINQVFTSGNQTWIWDGVKWVVGGSQTATSPYLPITGGTMTGALIAQAPGSEIDNAVIGAVTPMPASFTSLNGGPLSGFRNKIINGAFRIDQRNLLTQGAYQVGSGYVIDRWSYSGSQTNRFSLQANNGNTGALGNAGWLSCIVATPLAVAATDTFQVSQVIEGLNIIDLGWGFSGAKPVTLSFLFYSSIAGTHSGSICNTAAARNYVFTWNYPTANVWQYVKITIPGDTAGTWKIDNTVGLYVRFNLGSGANFSGTPGVWSANNYVGAVGAISVVGGANSFAVGNIQLELGSIATPFEFRPVGLEMSLCERYYRRYVSPTAAALSWIGYAAAGDYIQYMMPIPAMRAIPNCAFIGSWTQFNTTSFAISGTLPNMLQPSMQCTAAGYTYVQSPANGGFDVNAEL